MFESNCAGCHGLDGRGGERGPDISTRAQVAQLSDAQTLEFLREGKPASGMPAFDFLGNVKLKALLAYLQLLQGKDATIALPGEAAKGKALFFGKARCSECHMMRGQGGFLGRDLTHYGTAASPGVIREKIVGGVENADRGNRIVEVTLHGKSKISGIIRNEDNFSIQLQSPDGTFHLLSKGEIVAIETLPNPVMPTNYGKTLSAAEFDDLVNYLISEAKTGAANTKAEPEEEQ